MFSYLVQVQGPPRWCLHQIHMSSFKPCIDQVRMVIIAKAHVFVRSTSRLPLCDVRLSTAENLRNDVRGFCSKVSSMGCDIRTRGATSTFAVLLQKTTVKCKAQKKWFFLESYSIPFRFFFSGQSEKDAWESRKAIELVREGACQSVPDIEFLWNFCSLRDKW